MHKKYTCMIKNTVNALLSLQCYCCFLAVEQNICNIVVINGPQEFQVRTRTKKERYCDKPIN